MTAKTTSRAPFVHRRDLGALHPIGSAGGQGRVYEATASPWSTSGARTAMVVKLYHHPLDKRQAGVLASMVSWAIDLSAPEQALLHRYAAWPVALVRDGEHFSGIVLPNMRPRYAEDLKMPSGRIKSVLLSLEHFTEPDDYLQRHGIAAPVSTDVRAAIAQDVAAALMFLHRNSIVVSDVSANNLLISLRNPHPSITLIDCDSMVRNGRQALPSVESPGWEVPTQYGESPLAASADVYKLGLVVLRLFARDYDATRLEPHKKYVPDKLHGLLRQTLEASPARRPSSSEWHGALTQLCKRKLDRKYPGPITSSAVVAPITLAPGRPISPGPARLAPAPQPARARAVPPRAAVSHANGALVLSRLRRCAVRSLACGAAGLAALAALAGGLSYRLRYADAGAIWHAGLQTVWKPVTIGTVVIMSLAAVSELLIGRRVSTGARGRLTYGYVLVALVFGGAIGNSIRVHGGPYVPSSTWKSLVTLATVGVVLAVLLRDANELAAMPVPTSLRRRLIVLGAASAAVVLAAVAWTVGATNPPVHFSAADVGSLKEAVPLGHCRPTARVSVELRQNSYAEVICKTHQKSGRFFWVHPSAMLDVLASARERTVARSTDLTGTNCGDGAGFAGSWFKTDAKGVKLGRLLCAHDRHGSRIEWSDTRSSTYAIVSAPGSLRALKKWWTKHEITPSL